MFGAWAFQSPLFFWVPGIRLSGGFVFRKWDPTSCYLSFFLPPRLHTCHFPGNNETTRSFLFSFRAQKYSTIWPFFFLVKRSSSCVLPAEKPPWEIRNSHPNGFHGPQAASALRTPPDLIRWKMWWNSKVRCWRCWWYCWWQPEILFGQTTTVRMYRNKTGRK